MNQKIIIFLSIIIIVIGISGLLKTNKDNQKIEVVKEKVEKNKEVKIIKEKEELSLYILNRNLRRGELISLEDISLVKSKEDNKEAYFTQDDLNLLLNSLVLKDVSQGSKIKKDFIAKKGSNEYEAVRLLPKKGLSFSFPLDKRQFFILENVKKGQKVDIFFRYETALQEKKEALVSKRNDEGKITGDNPTNTNLVALFKGKTVLFNQRFITTKRKDELKENKNSFNKASSLAKKEKSYEGYLYVELSQSEIKKFITLENLGKVFIFPSSKNNTSFSTKEILSKEFIKELRGSSDDK